MQSKFILVLWRNCKDIFFCSLSFRSNRSAFSVPGSPPSNSSCCVKNGWNSVHSILSVAHPPSPSKNSSNAQWQLLRKLRERREKKLGPKKKKIWKLFLSQTREAFIWRSSWFFHRSVVLLSSFGIKKLVFGYKNLNSPAIMENRNTRLGGVRGRRPLGDLTTQQNNRQALLPNQETLPIKQVSYFGYLFRTLTFWRNFSSAVDFCAIFGTLPWSIDHCVTEILPADASIPFHRSEANELIQWKNIFHRIWRSHWLSRPKFW